MNRFKEYLEKTKEYGTVEQVRFPLIFASGLPEATTDEIVIFEDGQIGYVSDLQPDVVHIALLSGEPIQPGTRLTRTGQRLHIPVGKGQRGQILNPLGEPLLPGIKIQGETEQRLIDIHPLPIEKRKPIKRQFVTGTSVVDLLVPLAAGQREAVIGDLKTGKTSFVLAAAKAHANRGIVVFAAIGRPLSEIRRIADFVNEETNTKNVIVVASSAEDIPSLIILTPYAAMTVAEYWRDAGEDVLLILHDLSTHARYYREVALLSGRFPGRESYPGDIFHAHARLLERGGNFIHPEKKEASITCLVVGETVQNSVSGYIVSNLISITDGHLHFDSVRFAAGQRPAVDVAASVTRVGLKVQLPAAKQLNIELMAFLAKYRDAQQFTKFGSEMTEEVKTILATGKRLMQFFSQPAFLTVPLPVQLVLTTMIWRGWLNEQPEDTPAHWRDHLVQQYSSDPEAKRLFDDMVKLSKLEHLVQQIGENRPHIEELCQTATVSR
ncbi:MAG: hypothetical protein HYR90_00050 [Candidatus Andersenbacteria bacterium]|nr:hypothetical protein [Candidatus Andersenbacteria bacterium]MBI3250798.1 hypothetical protein [Candidatus Andersenbacteria bacterium]